MRFRGVAATCAMWAALLSTGTAQAEPADWPEGNAEADDGATRDYFNRGALLAWVAFHGDWVDRGGTLHGDDHWASITVDDTDTERYVEWDVADLVRAWLDGDHDNHRS